MSFSSDVKEELAKVLPNEEHCRLAELAALLLFYGKVEREPEIKVLLSTDNRPALRKCFTILNKTFNISSDAFVDENPKPKTVIELNAGNSDIKKVFERIDLTNPMSLLKRDCCKRSFLRGAFLGAGFIFDPENCYHLEISADNEDCSKLLTYLLSGFDITPKRLQRKRYFVTYLKEYESVFDVLSVIGAHKTMMDLANMRIEKNFRNATNRRTNCDLANISKALKTASKQIEDIDVIKKEIGLNALPDNLREMAVVREENQDSNYAELGELLNPPVGKSGVNHRLRKLSEIADTLRLEKEKK